MTDMSDSFRSGAAAYRNGRELTKQQRDRFIADANAVAWRKSAETRSFSRTGNTDVSSAVAEEPSSSETSADELALDYENFAKRRRRPMSSRYTSIEIMSCQDGIRIASG